MKRIAVICIAVCCALAIASSGAFANECNMRKGGFADGKGKMSCGMGTDNMFFHKAHMILDNAAELGLTNEQIEKVKALKYSVGKNVIKEDADIAAAALDIKEAMGKDEIDVNAVNKLIDQKYALKAQKAKDNVAAYVNLKKILSPDQFNKLKAMHKKGMKFRNKGGKGARFEEKAEREKSDE
ncbi:MAG: hypothetical protein PHI58_04040 [Candidatus Omnitrophica bacterium]|nr:hypothetical protein [Candidatus Omnitrophota bacterium]